MAPRKSQADKLNKVVPVEDYEHSGAMRTNNPPAGLAHLDRDETPTRVLSYDPHLDPQLVWAGKAERQETEVPAPSIHVHEELSAQKIVGSVRRQRMQQPLFDVTELDPSKAVEFYQHEMNWSNRMILGDSLVVMTSLLDRERLAGQVQCVFMDPPYGIKYQSNFQPNISNRNVTDGKDADLTREPEMIQAYRDTWELGIHSYLTYLRDRLTVARDLLHESGSVFVQIGEENMHRVRALLDEIFGAENYITTITYQKTTSSTSKYLSGVCDYIIWYARDLAQLKYRPLYERRVLGGVGASTYTNVELSDGHRRPLSAQELSGDSPLPEGGRVFAYDNLTSARPPGDFPVEFEGATYRPGKNYWKTSVHGFERLIENGRIAKRGNGISYIRYFDDFPARELNHLWTDTISSFLSDKRYVVQTNAKTIRRCLAMATDPGDLVIDPTCGSGTTAFVAEELGRRWITIDTSRVALAIARERLLTSIYPYYKLRDPSRDVDGGFEYSVLERITLRAIANDEDPEPVALVDEPIEDKKKVRVSGPFTVEALSRYAQNPVEAPPSAVSGNEDTANHVDTLLDALRTQGVPLPSAKPGKIVSLQRLSSAGALQAEGVVDLDGREARFAVSLGPRFGAITMAQVSDALREAIGYGLVVFAGFAAASDAQAHLGSGKVGGVPVALLLANPDLLAGDLLKNTSSSQTFRLYSSPDVRLEAHPDGLRLTVEGVDSFDAASGDVVSFGKSGIQAWFLDDAYDGRVFRVSQAFFPVSNGWDKLSKALRGTVDKELVEELHSWTSLPFDPPADGKIAVRVVANDGNASEVIIDASSAVKVG